ncbi:MAG: CPBP family intramembrane metalloprotease [bacterium]|nr:CPBP family intramembrane metalloprotease [bacterium]
MKKRKEVIMIVALITICCAIMAVVDGIIQPDYAVKSGIKIVVFLIAPIVYSQFDRELNVKEIFRWKKKGVKLTIGLAVGVYLIILGAYFVGKDLFDFSGVTESLTSNIGVTGERFVWVALYISFINSFLEEFFFRGFAFLTIKKLMPRKFAYLFSSFMFALYHVAMMTGWFSIGMYLITMVGLFIGGVIFDYLNEKNETIYSSWLVHMFANFAINTIGFILFGIL